VIPEILQAVEDATDRMVDSIVNENLPIRIYDELASAL
jgi:hypothetical protein